jgi:hypothetical protein
MKDCMEIACSSHPAAPIFRDKADKGALKF